MMGQGVRQFGGQQTRKFVIILDNIEQAGPHENIISVNRPDVDDLRSVK